MKFEIEGREYEWAAKMTIEEAFFLKEKAYLTIPNFGPAIAQVDPQSIACLIYFAKRRNGETAKWEDIQKLDILTFAIVEEPEAADEAGQGKAPEPTKGAGKGNGRTRKPGTSST